MKATLYTKPTCPYCVQAKALLAQKKIKFEDHDISNNPSLRKKISDSVGGYGTVPMIFLDGNFIGGYSELQRLDRQGGLA